MLLETEGGVKDDPKVASTGGRRNYSVVNGERECASFTKGGFGANEKKFCFFTVEFEEVVMHPFFYFRET